MPFNKDDIKHIAYLARLEFDDSELARLEEECAAILEFFGKLEELDTSAVEPLAHVGGEENVFREDGQPVLSGGASLVESAPEKKDGYIKTPPIFDA